MKKRKFKLFASVAAFALTGAMMTFGVLAAASHAVNVTTNVGFTSNGANGTIAVTANGETTTTATRTFTPSGFTGAETGDITLNGLTFAQTEGVAQDITISFTITKTGGAAANILTTTISVYNLAAPVLEGEEEDLSTPLDFSTADNAVAIRADGVTEGNPAYNNVTIKCNVAKATAATGTVADNPETTQVDESKVATITFTIHVVDSGVKVENIPLYFHVSVADGVPTQTPPVNPPADPEEGGEEQQG